MRTAQPAPPNRENRMADISSLKQNTDAFQAAAKKLGDTLRKSQVEWNDAQYERVRDAVRTVASMSKQVIMAGNRCEAAVKRFNSIESEQ